MRLFSTTEVPEKWFSEKELDQYSIHKNSGSLAARYLIKKRICTQTGDFGNKHEIEILNDPYGKPEIILGENMRLAIERAGIRKVLCSISHSRNYITGMTVFYS